METNNIEASKNDTPKKKKTNDFVRLFVGIAIVIVVLVLLKVLMHQIKLM